MKIISKRKEKAVLITVPDINKAVNEYHSLKRVNKSTSKFRIGFEVEKEDCDIYDAENAAKLYSLGWCKEEDSSLNDFDGYELVSPIYDLFTNSLKSDLEYKELREAVNADYSSNCGGHITISVKGMSGMAVYNKYIRSYVPLLYALYPSRMSNNYSEAFYNNIVPPKHHTYAVEVCRKVVEIRIFPAVINHKNLLWRQDLIRIIMSNPKKCTESMILSLIDKNSCINKFLNKFYKKNGRTDGYKKLFKRVVSYAHVYNFSEKKSLTLI